MFKKKRPEKVIEHEGQCVCVEAPMARNKLEGYVLDEKYRYQVIKYDDKLWVRLYPDTDIPEYYETCNSTVFKKYFKVIS